MHKNFVYIRQQGQEGEADRTTDYERNAFGQVTCVRDALGGRNFTATRPALTFPLKQQERESLRFWQTHGNTG